MPNRFNRLAPGSGTDDIVRMTNENFGKIDNEGVTKTFNGPNGGNSIVQGRYAEGRYGQVYYDDDGLARILIGQHPTDGHMGMWQSKEGIDVLTELET